MPQHEKPPSLPEPLAVGGVDLVRGARGAGITLMGQAAKILLQAAGLIVLSRILPPEAFGLVAMAAVFMALSELLRDFGMTTAGLQAKELNEQQASNLFWMSTALGAVIAGFTSALSPAIALAYREPRVTYIVLALAICTLLNGVQAQLQVRLARSMRYGALVATDLGAQVVGLSSGIGLAMVGWGYWALVAQMVVTSATMTLSRAMVCRWLPKRIRDLRETRTLFKAGVDFGLASGLTFLANYSATVVVGIFSGPYITGLYSRAYQLLSGPLGQIFAPLINVIVPTARLAEANDGAARRDDVLRRAQLVLGGCGVAVFALAAANPDEVVRLVLGSGWDAAAPYFQAFCVGGTVWALSNISFWGFIVTDASRTLLKYNLVTKLMTVAAVVATAPISALAAAWAYAICLVVSWPINLVWLARVSNYPSRTFFTDGVYVLTAGGAAFVAAHQVGAMGTAGDGVLKLTVSTLIGLAVYGGVLAIVPRTRRQFHITLATAGRALKSR